MGDELVKKATSTIDLSQLRFPVRVKWYHMISDSEEYVDELLLQIDSFLQFNT